MGDERGHTGVGEVGRWDKSSFLFLHQWKTSEWRPLVCHCLASVGLSPELNWPVMMGQNTTTETSIKQ